MKEKGFAPIIILLILVLVSLFFAFLWIKFKPVSEKKLPPELTQLKEKATRFTTFSLGLNDTPRVVAGNFTGYENKGDPYEIAISFFEDYKNFYHLTNPREDLKLENKETGDNGTKLVFSQIYQKIPIFGAQAIVWITKDNKINSVSSSLASITNLKITPKISEVDARKNSNLENAGKATLYIYAPQISNEKGNPQLAWLVEGDTENVFVDAEDGKLITAYATQYQALNRLTYDAQEQPQNPGVPMINEKGNALNLPSGKPDIEIQKVHKDLKTSYDYFYAKFDRDSWDNKGLNVISSLHYREKANKPFNNSFWHPSQNRVAFGTGWGNSVDITGHEYTHGVQSYSSNLLYQAQSGAMNESFADIFGTFIQFYSGSYDWTIGEGNGTKLTLRDMKIPAKFKQPDAIYDPKYQQKSSNCSSSNDYCGVHQNNSLLNKVAQLLVEGGKNNNAIVLPLGLEKTEQLLYFIMTQKLTSSSQFMDARAVTIDTAKNGFIGGGGAKYTFSDDEVISIMNAFASIGIGEGDSDFNGIPDNEEPFLSFLAILRVETPTDNVFPVDCVGNKDLDIYVLTSNSGFYQTEKKEISYSYVDEEKVYTGEFIDLGKYDKGGEFTKATWYHFKLNNFPKSGTIKYKVTLKGPQSIYEQSPETEAKISICTQKKLSPTDTASVLKTNLPKSQITLIPTNTPTPTTIPTPTATPQLQEKMVVVYSDSNLDGYVSSNGRIVETPQAGESSPGARAFLSFDFSQVPANAQIVSATLSTDGAIVTEEPFSLGNLSLINYDFDTLDISDYNGSGASIGTMTSLSTNSFNVLDNVKNRLSGNRRLQIKLQFDNATSENRTVDYLEFPSSRMSLTIVYK